MAAKRPPFHSMLFPAVAMLAILGALMVLPPTTPAQTYKVLYRFTGPPNDGGVAVAGLVFDRLGNLYGTTEVGGSGGCFGGTGCGTVYQLTPGSSGAWTEQVIHNFQGTDGQDIFAPVIVDGSGNLRHDRGMHHGMRWHRVRADAQWRWNLDGVNLACLYRSTLRLDSFGWIAFG
jgi:hypothetical protein